ncbi:hypothetical protein [Demequina sp.]|uniref:hypothetical protein n=1 Tax=Demequina sp. TaxID=2050685 RepID=UPI003A83F921
MGFTPTRGAFEYIAKAQDPEVTGPELLTLAVHRNSAVRTAVASRPDCPVSALISLGHDSDHGVLRALIANPRTPLSVMRALADHRNTEISGSAVQRLRNGLA